MMIPSFKPKSALDLILEGSIGSFRISDVGSSLNQSIEVVYLETHVGFDPQVDFNDKLLKHLAPVREIFDTKTLNFDEIMQRDIDDARVSTELIPYLLDKKSRGSVKFFPPIVIVVLPVKDQTILPDTKYPKVAKEVHENPEYKGTQFSFIRSGAIGMEAFEFEYPLYEGRPRKHDYARLKLNTSKVKLVIIDGQHRAMALLALYRNLKSDWNDERRTAYKDYYAEWTKNRISDFNLNDLQLPIILCTFPEIDVDYQGNLTLIEAARSMFLTLNENAKKVSKSRNLLLDDQDLISHFMRETLRTIKARDLHATSSLRIWSVELDQDGDQKIIESQMACTGVTHCYYIIEHLLLNDEDVQGISARSGRFSTRKSNRTTETLLGRLDGENLLGASNATAIKRDDYSKESAKKLTDSFMERYGKYLVNMFDQFAPFEIHNKAALNIEASLKGNTNPQISKILFDGQNINKSFGKYREHMEKWEKQLKNSGLQIPPEIRSIIDTLRGTDEGVHEKVNQFKENRVIEYLNGFNEKSKLKTIEGSYSRNIVHYINKLYNEVYLTVAFQAALVCGFFEVVELAERKGSSVSRETAFKEYVDELNSFFLPSTMARMKNLIRVFFNEVKDDSVDKWDIRRPLKVGESFREVIFRSEMKPDEWPKYRSILLELWEPTDPILRISRDEELQVCRSQAIKSLHFKKMEEYCQEHRKGERDLEKMDWDEIFKRTFDSFNGFLSHLVSSADRRMSKADARLALQKPKTVEETERQIEEVSEIPNEPETPNEPII